MRLSRLVETSVRVTATSKRLEKIGLIASLLEQLHPDEVEIAVSFLSGNTLQGRIGIGYATLRNLSGAPAAEPSLEITEVNYAFETLKSTSGGGSAARKQELLGGIFSRATAEEQRFLIGL